MSYTKVGKRIYFIKSDDKVIFERSDIIGTFEDISIEIEKEINPYLLEYEASEIGCIEYKYGEFNKLMEEAKANKYRIVEGKVEFYYEKPPEPEIGPVPETEETEEQKRIRELEEELKKFKIESQERINKLSNTTLDLILELSNVDASNDEPNLEDIF